MKKELIWEGKISYMDIKAKKVRTITIHSGQFHADDVYCAALVKLINRDIRIIRTRLLGEFEGLCCDVGGGRYDHHSKGKEKKEARDNGVCYAAFGKLWRDIGYKFCCDFDTAKVVGKKKLFRLFDKYFIEQIDARDNGQFGYKEYERTIQLPDIDVFNRAGNKEKEAEQFEIALGVAQYNILLALEICKRYMIQDIAEREGMKIVKKASKNLDGGVLVLDQPCNWQRAATSLGKRCMMIVMPEADGYVAYGVPSGGAESRRRCYFPREWAVGEDASKASGVPQMKFCYSPNGFMAAFRGEGARQAAVRACKIAIAKQRGENFVV